MATPPEGNGNEDTPREYRSNMAHITTRGDTQRLGYVTGNHDLEFSSSGLPSYGRTTTRVNRTIATRTHHPVRGSVCEDMKLFFLWPHIQHDLRHRIRDQGPKTLHKAILTTQCIEAEDAHDLHTSGNLSHDHTNTMPTTTPMDIDVQNAQLRAK